MDKWEDQYHLREPGESDDPSSSDNLPQNGEQNPDQWHIIHDTNPQKPATEGFWRRLWRMWSAFFIKLGISWLVSLVISTVLMLTALAARGGYDYAAMEALMEDEAVITAVSNEVALELTEYTVPIEGLAAILTIPILVFMFHRDQVRRRLSGLVSKMKAPAVDYLSVIIMAAALCVGLNGLFMISGLSTGDESYVESMELMYSPSLPIQLLCMGLLSPVCEELTYRGLIYKRMRGDSSFLSAALYSTIIFALMHGYLVSIIYAFIMGFIFAWLYEKYNSFLAPAAAHMTANIISVLATYFNWFDWLLEEPVRIGVLIVACAAAASTMYVLIRRRLDMEEDEGGQEGQEL